MKVLVTGFDPFGGEQINPALEAVRRLPQLIAGAEVVVAEVPTVFHESLRVLGELIDREDPDLVICVGQAGGRAQISLERVAINVDDARIADNQGNQPVDQPVVAAGPAAYFTTLPVKAMVAAVREVGLPAGVTNSAGTFVCNHLFYGLMHRLAADDRPRRGGFIHVPYIPEQVMDKPPTPSMSLTDMVTGLTAAIAAALENDQDIATAGGEIC